MAVGGDDRDRAGRVALLGRKTQEGALWFGGDERADEALCYRWLVGEWRQSWIYSLLCNAISFLTGELFVLISLLFTY